MAKKKTPHVFHGSSTEEVTKLATGQLKNTAWPKSLGKSPSNTIRAAWAGSTLEAFRLVSHAGPEDYQTLMADLMTDFMHLCHRNEGIMNFEKALRRAQSNFIAEAIKEKKEE